MANRIRNERLEIKLTKEEKALFEEKRKLAKVQKYEPFYPQMRFRKGNISSRFRTFQRFTRLAFQCYKQHQSDCKENKFDRYNLQRGHQRYKERD